MLSSRHGKSSGVRSNVNGSYELVVVVTACPFADKGPTSVKMAMITMEPVATKIFLFIFSSFTHVGRMRQVNAGQAAAAATPGGDTRSGRIRCCPCGG